MTTRALKMLPVLPAPVDRAFPFTLAQGRIYHLVRLAGLDVFLGVEDGGVRLADHFLGVVPVNPAGALVPEQDLSVEVLADDGILRGGLQEVRHEVHGVARLFEIVHAVQLAVFNLLHGFSPFVKCHAH